MAQGQVQVQKQEQALKQTQNFSQQQLLQAHLVELPINQLVERINAEMDDNPALEAESPGDDMSAANADYDDGPHDDTGADDDFDVRNEREERQSALDDALSNIGRDDEDLPVYHGGLNTQDEREDMVYGEAVSFYDQLKEQMGEMDLDDNERQIMEYLIGSLDDDGLLRKSLDSIADELAIYQGVDVGAGDIERVLDMMQQYLDPPGIGARSLQECLSLQVMRRPDSRLKTLMMEVIGRYFDDFTKKHWQRIRTALSLTEIQAGVLMDELRKLNPKPGASMGETVGRSMQQITPDFIVDTHEDLSLIHI